jgi:hypothetical protein
MAGIYEFDFEKYFNKISLNYMFNEMLDIGLPVQLCEYVLRVNSNVPGTREDEYDKDDGEIESVLHVSPFNSKHKILNSGPKKTGMPQGLP